MLLKGGKDRIGFIKDYIVSCYSLQVQDPTCKGTQGLLAAKAMPRDTNYISRFDEEEADV